MTFDRAYLGMGRLDRLSYQDTFVHRLDPRVKVMSTLLFLLAVVSYPKYEVAALLPFFLFPVLFMAMGDIPAGFVLRKVLVVSPFAVFVGIFNPAFDRDAALYLLGVPVSAGWVSFLSIVLKFTLSISAAILLIATTSFPRVCHALQRMGMPGLFTSQLVFLYRYMFVLMEEALRMLRAQEMRSFGGRSFKVSARLVGILFIRTVERAERIYKAMLSRGFQGDIPQTRPLRLAVGDLAFSLSALAYLAACRFLPVTEAAGRLFQRFTG